MSTSLALGRERSVTTSAQDVARHALAFQHSGLQLVGGGVVLDGTVVHALVAALVARAPLAYLIVEPETRAPQTPRMALSAHGFAGQGAQSGAALLQRPDPLVVITVRTRFVLVQTSLLEKPTTKSRFRSRYIRTSTETNVLVSVRCRYNGDQTHVPLWTGQSRF